MQEGGTSSRPIFAHATVVEGQYSQLPEQAQAAVMPDGSLVMLSVSNPYQPAIAKARRVERGPMHVDDAAYEQFYRPALALERMARIVRVLAMFDLIFSLLHAFSNQWPAAVVALMSYCGYIGARTFRRDLIRIYLFYLVVFAVARMTFSAALFAQQASQKPAAGNGLPIYMAVAAGVQIVIAHFVWRFYSMLPTSLNEARFVQLVSERTTAMPI